MAANDDKMTSLRKLYETMNNRYYWSLLLKTNTANSTAPFPQPLLPHGGSTDPSNSSAHNDNDTTCAGTLCEREAMIARMVGATTLRNVKRGEKYTSADAGITDSRKRLVNGNFGNGNSNGNTQEPEESQEDSHSSNGEQQGESGESGGFVVPDGDDGNESSSQSSSYNEDRASAESLENTGDSNADESGSCSGRDGVDYQSDYEEDVNSGSDSGEDCSSESDKESEEDSHERMEDKSSSVTTTRQTRREKREKHTPEELERKKRSKFMRERIALSREIFKKANHLVFGNKLAGDMAIIWSPKLVRAAGYCCHSKTKKTFIKLSPKILTTYEKLRDTLLHEMCHAAVSDIDNNLHAKPHGKEFKQWGRRVEQAYGGVKITTTHRYSLNFKYMFKCTKCSNEIGRHSKSINTSKETCGVCGGTLELVDLRSKTTTAAASRGTTLANDPSSFLYFAREQTPSVRAQLEAKTGRKVTQKEVMQTLASMWPAVKAKRALAAITPAQTTTTASATASSTTKSPTDT